MHLRRRQYQLSVVALIACATLLGAFSYAKPWTSRTSDGNSAASGEFGKPDEFSFPPLSVPGQPSIASVPTRSTDQLTEHAVTSVEPAAEAPAFPADSVVNPSDVRFGESEEFIDDLPDLTELAADSVGGFRLAGSVPSRLSLNNSPSARSRAAKSGLGGGASGGVPSSGGRQQAKNGPAGEYSGYSDASGATASTMGSPSSATGLFPLTEFPGNGPAGRSGLSPFTASSWNSSLAASPVVIPNTGQSGATNLGQPVSVPEPSSLFLLAGAVALAARRLRRA